MRTISLNKITRQYLAFIIIIFAFIGFFGSYYFLQKNLRLEPIESREILVFEDSNSMKIIYDTLHFNSMYYPNYTSQMDSISIDSLKDNQKKVEYKSIYFNLHHKYLIWLIVFSLMTGYAFAFLPLLIIRVSEDVRNSMTSIVEIALILVVSVGILILLIFKSGDSIYLLSVLDINKLTGVLMNNKCWLELLIAINILIGMIAFAGQLLIGLAIPRLSENLNQQSFSSTLKKFNHYRDSLKFYLSFSGGMISFSVITSSFLRKSILGALDAGNFQLFPLEFIFAYGMTFTVVLAIFYLPVYYQLRLKGSELQKAYSGILANDPDHENKVEEFSMTEKGISNFKVALSILSPLLTSLLGDIINLA